MRTVYVWLDGTYIHIILASLTSNPSPASPSGTGETNAGGVLSTESQQSVAVLSRTDDLYGLYRRACEPHPDVPGTEQKTLAICRSGGFAVRVAVLGW